MFGSFFGWIVADLREKTPLISNYSNDISNV